MLPSGGGSVNDELPTDNVNGVTPETIKRSDCIYDVAFQLQLIECDSYIRYVERTEANVLQNETAAHPDDIQETKRAAKGE